MRIGVNRIVLKLLQYTAAGWVTCLLGCDDRPTILSSESVWLDSEDTIRDGALRVEAITFKRGRDVIVRCFGGRQSDFRQLDVRYSINVPILKRLEKDFKDKSGITLSISVDKNVARIYDARAGYGGDGLWFLAAVDQETVQAIADAKEKVFVIPRMNGEDLDDSIEFGAYGAREHISKVIDACQQRKPVVPETSKKSEPEKKKDT